MSLATLTPGWAPTGTLGDATAAASASGPGDAARGALPLGSRIGHLRIVDILGEGGMGTVFTGFDEKLERHVAIKVIQPQGLSAEARLRFLREARILSQLRHPHICQIHEYVARPEGDFLVLELIDGRDLERAMAEGLAGPDRWRIAEQIVDVLVAAHGQGIIHRDLKPQNVMLTREGEVKVLDFGIARAVQGPAVPSTKRAAAGSDAPLQEGRDSATALGVVVGTLAYMSPEQARGDTLTTASDMYSCGLLLQELFTGRPACPPGLTAVEKLARAQAGVTEPVRGVPAELQALIQRSKSTAPAARPSAVDALDRLRWIRQAPRRRRRRLGLVAGFVAVALVAVGMTLQAARISREVDRANQEAEAARQVSELLVGLFEVADPSGGRGGALTVREILDSGAEKVERELAEQPLVQARMMHTLGTLYQELGLYERSRAMHERALAIREQELGPKHLAAAETLEELAGVHLLAGDSERAEAALVRALEIRRSFQGLHPEVAELLNDLAEVHAARGQPRRALALHAQALAIQERTLDPAARELGDTLYKLAALHQEVGDLRRAETLLSRALAVFQSWPEEDPEARRWRATVGAALASVRRLIADSPSPP